MTTSLNISYFYKDLHRFHMVISTLSLSLSLSLSNIIYIIHCKTLYADQHTTNQTSIQTSSL